MKENNTFEIIHPVILFSYFAFVILITMFDPNIITGICSEAGSLLLLCLIMEQGKKTRQIVWNLLLIGLMTITNPLFSHNGATPLIFINGQAITKEAVIYGLHLGLMLSAVLNWFRIQYKCIGTDKWLYLTARLMPGLALLLSMVFRLIPIMKEKYQEMKRADAGLLGSQKLSWGDKVIKSLKLFLGMAGWTMEYMPQLSASMRARGYGGRRTSYSIYHFRLRDALELITILIISITAIGVRLSAASDYYYPYFHIGAEATSYIYYIMAGILFLLPSVREGVDRAQWMYYRSKI